MTTDRHQDDWHFGTTGVLLVGSLTAVLAAVAYPYGWFPAWLPAALAGFGAALAVLTGRLRHHTLGTVLFRASCWLAFGGWATTIDALGMNTILFMALGAIILAAAMLSPLFAPEEDPLPPAAVDPARSVDMEWKKRIDKICNVSDPGVTITAKEMWERGTGYTLTVEGPPGSGFTFKDLDRETIRLSAAAHLKPGCSLNAMEGPDHQGQAMLNVPTINDLANAVEYPLGYTPLTVNDTVPIGIFSDGTLVEVEVREGSTLVIGRKGGGKTTLLHDFTGSLARCPDALIWHIDMNAGGMSAPWLLPWLEEKCDTPVIDWFAHDEQEALLMSRAALAIVLERKKRYTKSAVRANSSLIPITPRLPEIFLMIDEAAEVLGEDSECLELGDNIRKIMRMGRAVGVNVLISALRPVGDHLPVQVRKNCVNRIGMRVEESSEYDYTFDDARGCEPHMIKNKGEAYILRGEVDSTPVKFRTFNMLPDQITEMSIATAHLRPELDAKSLNAPGVLKIYSERWDRCEGYLNDLLDEDDQEQPTRPPVDWTTPPAGTNRATTTEEEGDTKTRPEDKAAADKRARDAEVARLNALFKSAAATDEDRAREEMAALGEGAELVMSIVTRPMMMAQIIGEVEGAGKQVTRQTVFDWVKEAVTAERLTPTKKKGQYQPVDWSAPEGGEAG